MLFLTARSDEIDRVVGLELGADDYVAKPFSPRELVARVRGILRRSVRRRAGRQRPRPRSPSCWTRRSGQIRFYGRALELSRYEYGILRLLVQRPGRVFTRDELLTKVWDDDAASFDRTVDAHIKTLRAKLKAVRARRRADPHLARQRLRAGRRPAARALTA